MALLFEPPTMMARRVLAASGTLQRKLQWTNEKTLSRRFLMDAKTRPSHSRMFVEETTASATKTPPSEVPNPTPEWQVYLIIAQRVALAWGMIHILTEYGVDITLCEGPSMMPTIHECGEMLLVDKCFVRIHGVRDGESIRSRVTEARQRQAQHSPGILWHERLLSTIADRGNDKQSYTWMDALKHYLLHPLSIGDVVVADHPNRPGTICKRIAALPGDQVLLRNKGGRLETVPNGHVWLEGDNSMQSNDSRHYGPIPLALLKGRAIARIWPLRGSAWMERRRNQHGSTVLPAGYRGEHIAKSKHEYEAIKEDPLNES